MSAGDEILSLDGREITKATWLKTLARHKPGDPIAIRVKRDRRTLNTILLLKEVERFEYRIEEDSRATPEQKTLRNAWLKGTRN